MSEQQEISRSVLQWSVLGLVLLSLFINDLEARVENFLIKFAGDIKLQGTGNNLENRQDHEKLENKMKHNAGNIRGYTQGRENKHK